MTQILGCGNLDIKKFNDESITIYDKAWVAADVDEQIYLYKTDPADEQSPTAAFIVIKFSSPCVATLCDNQTPRGIQWTTTVPQDGLKEEQGNYIDFAINISQQLSDYTNGILRRFGAPETGGVFLGPVVYPIPPNITDYNLINNVGLDHNSLNDFGFQSVAVRPLAAVIPIKSNVEPYGPWVSDNFWTSTGGADIVVDPDLAPWTFGSRQMLNSAGETLVEYNQRGIGKVENGSVTIIGIPSGLSILGSKVDSIGPNLTSVNFSLGSKGATTTYEFKTYTPKFGKLSKLFIDRYKNFHKQRIKQLKLLRNITSRQNKLYRKIIARTNRIKLDTIAADARKNSMQRVIMGYMFDWYDLQDGSTSQKTVVGMTTLSKACLDLRPGVTIASLDSVFIPASQPHRPEDDTVLYPIHPLSHDRNARPPSINAFSYYPFSKGGEHPFADGLTLGHSIDILGTNSSQGSMISDSGIIKSFYPPWEDSYKYTADGVDNFMAIRGPIMLRSWGYDIDGKPVPNASDDESSSVIGGSFDRELSDYFAPNWLQKPRSWPSAPIDLRLDRKRGVWVSPQPHAIMAVNLDKGGVPANGGGTATLLENENTKISVIDKIGKSYAADTKVYVYYDTRSDKHIILQGSEHEIEHGTAMATFSNGGIAQVMISSGPINATNIIRAGALEGDVVVVSKNHETGDWQVVGTGG